MTYQSDAFASSTGQVMTGAIYLDNHFESARPQYEAQLRAVGIQPSWRVLDAACGSGPFLPWLADLVGPTGHLAALDLAPDNVALVEQRLADWRLPCPVEARVGSVLDLPYPDDAFDAVWFANTSQYLTDAELAVTLAEFRRVIRPGGLVALKESDVTMFRVVPGPPGLILRWFQAHAAAGNVQSAGSLRTPELPRWLRREGLRDVWQRTTPIEHTAPFRPVTRTAWRDGLSYLAGIATGLDLPDADQAFWSQLGDAAAIDRYLDDPDCWFIECNVLTVGTVPHARGTTA